LEAQEAHPLEEDAVTVPPGPVLLKLKADMSFFVFFDLHAGHGTEAACPLTISSNSLPQRVQRNS